MSLFRSVDLPTDGKPTSPTRASPDLETSNPVPAPPPPPPCRARHRRQPSLTHCCFRSRATPSFACLFWFEQVSAQLGELGLEQAQVSCGGFVLLRPRHLVFDVPNLLHHARHGFWKDAGARVAMAMEGARANARFGLQEWLPLARPTTPSELTTRLSRCRRGGLRGRPGRRRRLRAS